MPMFACPSRSWTTLGCTPAAAPSSPSRGGGRAAGSRESERCTASVKVRLNRSGCSSVPSTRQNTRSGRSNPPPSTTAPLPAASGAHAAPRPCPASSVTVRRPFAVLGVPSIGRVLHRDDRLSDRRPPRVEIEVAPAQPEGLTTSHAGRGEEEVGRADAGRRASRRGTSELLGGPRHRLRAPDAAGAWRVGGFGRVADQSAPLHRVLERPVRDGVDVTDRRGDSRPRLVVFRPSPAAARTGRSASRRPPRSAGRRPEVWQEVQAQVAGVGVVRGGRTVGSMAVSHSSTYSQRLPGLRHIGAPVDAPTSSARAAQPPAWSGNPSATSADACRSAGRGRAPPRRCSRLARLTTLPLIAPPPSP